MQGFFYTRLLTKVKPTLGGGRIPSCRYCFRLTPKPLFPTGREALSKGLPWSEEPILKDATFICNNLECTLSGAFYFNH